MKFNKTLGVDSYDYRAYLCKDYFVKKLMEFFYGLKNLFLKNIFVQLHNQAPKQ